MAQQKGMEEFQRALKILRSDKLRGFKVDIETDATISADAEADKATAVELVQAVLQGLKGAGETLMMAPELVPAMGDLLLFAFRRFRIGRTIEASFEDAFDQIGERIEASKNQPPPPSPEQVKAQAEMQKQQMETQRAQEEHQMDMQAKQADLEIQRQKNAMEIEKLRAELEIDQQRLELEREKLGIQREGMMMKAAVEPESTAKSLLEKLLKGLKDQIRERNGGDGEGCGDPDCPNCGPAIKAAKKAADPKNWS